MTEQAILDLPLVEFEQFDGSIDAIRRHCAQIYGLVGLPPHPDTVFHFAASLWRCHANESHFQVAAIAAFYLRAVSHHAAAERRTAAAREAARELRGQDASDTVANADENLRYAREDAEALGRVVLAVAAELTIEGRNRGDAQRRLDHNLRALADERWQSELAQMVTPLLGANPDLVDWSLPLNDVLDELARERQLILRVAAASSRSGRLGALMTASGPAPAPVTEPRPADGRAVAAQLEAQLAPLRHELAQARTHADQLNARLEQALRDKGEVEQILHATERNFTDQSLALEEAKNALQLTLNEVRDRLNRLEADSAPAGEIEQLRAQQAALSEELTQALEQAAVTEAQREEMFAAHEAQQSEAVKTIEDLHRKVEEQQAVLQQAEGQLAEMNNTLDGMRKELVESEQRYNGAQKSIGMLEAESAAMRAEADRFAQAESLLTEAESRLAEAEQRAVEADLRVQQIEQRVAEKDVKIANAEQRLRDLKVSFDKVAAQATMADKTSQERQQVITRNEAELNRMRAEAAGAQRTASDLQKQVADLQKQQAELRKQLNDESSRFRQIAERERRMSEDSGKLKSSLDEHRQTSARLKASLDQRERELGDLRTEVREKSTLRDRTESEAKNLRYDFDKLAREHEDLRKATDEYRRRLTETELRLMDAEQKLLAADEDASASDARAKDAQEKLSGDLLLLRDRLKNADNEKQILLDALSRSEENRRVEKAELEKQMETLRAESAQRHQAMLKVQGESEKTRKRLDESDAFLISRQREMDRVNNKLRYVLGEISAIADLRARIENTRNEEEVQQLGSEVAKRLDNLFSEAGSPIHADRKTEKILILHLKKNADEQSKDARKPVLAIGANAQDDESAQEKTSLGLEIPDKMLKRPKKGD